MWFLSNAVNPNRTHRKLTKLSRKLYQQEHHWLKLKGTRKIHGVTNSAEGGKPSAKLVCPTTTWTRKDNTEGRPKDPRIWSQELKRHITRASPGPDQGTGGSLCQNAFQNCYGSGDSFPTDAITKYPKFSGLKQHKFMMLEIRNQVQVSPDESPNTQWSITQPLKRIHLNQF